MFNPFKRNDPVSATDPQELGQNLIDFQEKCAMLQRSTSVLLHFVKAFALDIQELHTEQFKTLVDELDSSFNSAEKTKRIEANLDHRKDSILTFIDQQRAYVEDREKELRDIIDLLTKALANLNIENREFYQRVYDQGEKIIEISLLDDIKKIKNALKQEVETMRDTVDQKKEQENRKIQILAGQVHVLQKELEQAKEKSVTDGLTGIYNRQAFNDYLAEKVERCAIMKTDFCLLLVDIDNFKTINDQFGHLLGDRVLMACAQKCRAAVRGEDFVSRYGGEEFAIVLMGSNFRNGLNKASQICKIIAATRYATNEAQKDGFLSMTVSIGVTPFKKGDTVESIIARSDKALYEAKHRGKNMAIGRKS